jgi:zinc protease
VLREDLGGVYGVGVGGGITRVPREERSFSVQFGCAPENVEKLKKAVFDEIKALKENGIGDDYLDKIRTTRRRSRELDLTSNGVWADWLADTARFGDSLDDLLDLEADLARVSSANVQDAAKRFLETKQYVVGVLLPEAVGDAAEEKPAKKGKTKGLKSKRDLTKAVPDEPKVKP